MNEHCTPSKKSRYSHKNTANTLHNEVGAIDLASIMLGLVVMGTITSLIASTIFVVIPWAQDNAAKHQLDSVVSAQSAYVGLETAKQTQGYMYGNLKDLINANIFPSEWLSEAPEEMLSKDNTLCVSKTNNGKGYEATVRSATGNVFKITDQNTKPIKVSAAEMLCGAGVLGSGENGTEPTSTVSCGNATYTAVGHVSISCDMQGGASWGGHLMQHRLTLTPTSDTLSHWKVLVDMSGLPTLQSIKAYGPNGFDPYIDGTPRQNVLFKLFSFTAEGNANNMPPESPVNHWYTNKTKGIEILEFEIQY
jgi:hypothetical protein